MEKLILLTLSVLVCLSTLCAQSAAYWSKVYDLNSAGYNQLSGGLIDFDSCIYITASGACGNNSGSGLPNICLQRAAFDLDGEIKWVRFNPDMKTEHVNVLRLKDETLLVGIDYPNGLESKDFGIVQYDLQGDETKKFDFYDSCAIDLGRDIELSRDAVFFNTFCEKESDSSRYGLVYRIDKNLTRVERIYQLQRAYPAFSDMAVRPDGKLAVAYTNPYVGWTASYIDCFDTTGQVLWQFTHPYIQSNFRKWSTITTTKDGGYFVTWALDTFFYIDPPGYWTNGYYTFVYKVNGDGELLWSKIAIGGYTAWTKEISNAVEAENGDLLRVGANENLQNLVSPQIFPVVFGLGYAIRLNPEGELLWERTYLDTLNKPIFTSSLRNAVELPDKGWILLGEHIADVPPNEYTGQDVWLLRVDSMGCLVPGCSDTLQITTGVTQSGGTKPSPLKEFVLWPNPGGEKCNLSLKMESWLKNQEVLLRVYNLQGQVVYQESFWCQLGTQIDMSDKPSGLYYFEVLQQDGISVFQDKWLKIN